MIDNYDSFTYNLVQYLGELGAELEVRRNDAIDVAGVRAMAPQAIVISPGPCTPKEAGVSVALLREMAREVPIVLSWASAWAINASARPLAPRWCARDA